ncbi:MAG: hypothetical protein Hyperionvirus8_60 [Hyperionvirus sp.]|uniref:Sulfhydryl oxidase n=1 Tax=Hyperionvirus sp. TaxID=2487770 RepID=A0A3G5A8H8_9VIRU|nr:MAG: hypothetical protein Hyperionvirus8_60 [Hyperionvirus sp.]
MTDDPQKWGPDKWREIHQKTLRYPRNPSQYHKRKMYEYFMNLPDELPCETCAKHLTEHLNTYPLTYQILSSRKRLCCWTVDIHNLVNKSLGKRELSYEEAFTIHLSHN